MISMLRYPRKCWPIWSDHHPARHPHLPLAPVDPERLTSALPLLADENTTLLLSAASSWEIAVKWGLGKLALPEAPETYVPDRMQRDAIDALPVLHSHALAVAKLPHHHRDPFDRLSIAQTISERIPLATADQSMRAYAAELLWVG